MNAVFKFVKSKGPNGMACCEKESFCSRIHLSLLHLLGPLPSSVSAVLQELLGLQLQHSAFGQVHPLLTTLLLIPSAILLPGAVTL